MPTNNLRHSQPNEKNSPNSKSRSRKLLPNCTVKSTRLNLKKFAGNNSERDALAELADAKATILKQGDKIRELERGYKFKPNPAEAALRLEIGNLQAELEAYRQQQPATEFELPDALELLNELRTKRKKSKVEAEDVKLLLQLISDSFDEN